MLTLCVGAAFAAVVMGAVELPKATRSEVYAPRAMAATSQPLATQVALEVMRAGGTAVDGAIAANAALGLMEPTGCGVGGDLFAIVWDPKSGRLHGYNGSGRAGSAMTIELVRRRGLEAIPAHGPLPVTVPGCVDGWFALHERFGRLPMKDVLAPAARYARDGFGVTPVIAEGWAINVENLKGFPGFVEQMTIGGRAPRAGETWRNENLARLLERLGREGRGAFYHGEVPATIEKYLKEQGGVLTAGDFAAHRGEWVEPVSVSYRGYDVWEIPPSGQGIAALQTLKILEGYDLRSMGWGSADHLHAIVEAKKLAFADRARYCADPAFGEVPVARLLSPEYAAKRGGLIDMGRAALRVEPGAFGEAGGAEPAPEPKVGSDTVYLTVADSDGMMVSLIQSNYRGMGSGMTPPGLGFVLQDRGEQFALVPGHPNALMPGKRPMHTIIPAFITKDGRPWMSFGVMGGAMQPQGHVQIVVNLIDFGMTLQQAGDAPRLHHDGSTEPQGSVRPMTDGGVLNLEPGFPEGTVRELERRGHRIKPAPTAVFGGYQAIRRVESGWEGASESRKDGVAGGY
jgi:gamma-glutamyltranspeptidase/glutathione hydrolase